MDRKSKPYWAVIADGFGPYQFHYLKQAKECYEWCIKNHVPAPELYRVNQKPTGTGRWIRK